MKVNRDALAVVLSLTAFFSVVVVNSEHKRQRQRQQQIADSERSFRVVNLHDGDVLTGVFTLTADVMGGTYGYTDVWLVVDGQSMYSTESAPTASGGQQLQFTLRTFEHWNGAHSVCLAEPSGNKQCRKVTFRNKYLRIHMPNGK